MTGKFFKDGNRRMALILETFIMMRSDFCLPTFYNEKDWLVAAPSKDEKYPENNSEKEWEFDGNFMKWYSKYSQLFGIYRGNRDLLVEIEHMKPTDAWRVMNQGALNRLLETKHTIYDVKNILQEPFQVKEYVEKTGLGVKRIVVFRPERVLLHELITEVNTRIALPDNDDGKMLREIVDYLHKQVQKKRGRIF